MASLSLTALRLYAHRQAKSQRAHSLFLPAIASACGRQCYWLWHVHGKENYRYLYEKPTTEAELK